MQFNYDYNSELRRLISESESALLTAKKVQADSNEIGYLFWLRRFFAFIEQIDSLLRFIDASIYEVNEDTRVKAEELLALVSLG